MFDEKYKFFVKIVTTGSITKAADNLFISQSALSKYLSRLESSLNTKLFDRSSYPLQLTKSGKIFLQYVLQGMENEKECLMQINGLKDNKAETLRIGIGRWRGSCMLPQILPSFLQKYPYINISIFEGSSDEIADGVFKGRIDIAIMGQYNHYPLLGNIHLSDELILLTANSSHPLVKNIFAQNPGFTGFIHLDIALFQQELFIMTSSRQGLSRVVEDYFSQIHFVPKNTMLIDNLTTGMYLVSQSNYFTFLPEIVVNTHTPPKNLSFMTLGDPKLHYQVGITFNNNTGMSPAAELFSDAVQTYYKANSSLRL